jgi:hypothetical protein
VNSIIANRSTSPTTAGREAFPESIDMVNTRKNIGERNIRTKVITVAAFMERLYFMTGEFVNRSERKAGDS